MNLYTMPPVTLTVDGSMVIMRFVARQMHAKDGDGKRAPGPYREFGAAIQCSGETNDNFLHSVNRACAALLKCARTTVWALETDPTTIENGEELACMLTPGGHVHQISEPKP